MVTALTLLGVASQSIGAVAILLVDGALAVLVVATLTLAGTWIVPVLRAGPLPLRWHLLIGAGTGLGVMPALLLTIGLVGELGPTSIMILATASVIAAFAAIVRLSRLAYAEQPATSERQHPWLWLLITPFLVVTLLVSVVPPGFLWIEEGAGYDVLEYHLQLPKEYLERGCIDYTPHNVYGNFPANVEMLYLLSMSLRGDPYNGAATAKILNALFAILFVLAAYVAGRETSQLVGVVTAVVAAGVGWLTYLSGVAYVENGMLLFSMIAAAGLIRAARPAEHDKASNRWYVLAGLMAGFACGCKYTALLLVAAPLTVFALLIAQATWPLRIRATAAFALAAIVGFAPWMVKNTLMTANPVFPFANSVFKSYPEGWREEEARHFKASHEPDPAESSVAARVEQVWRKIIADPKQRFGPLLFLLPAVRLFSRRRNHVDLLLLVMFLLQLLGWTLATHLYARFAVPMIIPLIILAGRAFGTCSPSPGRRILTATLVAGVAFSAFMTVRHYAQHLYQDGRKLPMEGADLFFLDGLGGGHEHLSVINHKLADDAKILMVGDARAFYFKPPVDYCVVFNRNPFVEVVAGAGTDRDILNWLRKNGYTHVFVNWAEVARLAGSRYGFPKEIQLDLFQRLAGKGLEWMETFSTGDPPQRYAELYRVSQ
ncbi:MAG: glycosyltransferase family 39 protein [Phycisphaerae bacterium]